ncbi:MAG: DUF262 domain-containing protein, partial [Candidatus Thermoplasmatota archaeon]|nr:DUF262 domain-containing protein [Candidatus Thermoplasmatota archaeon]
MDITPTNPKISQLFGDGDSILRVPKYQRAYEWDDEDCERLFQDIDRVNGHFLGSIVCLKTKAGDLEEPNLDRLQGNFRYYYIIDGQQRLATISLLYAAILKKILELAIDVRQKNPEDFPRIFDLTGKSSKIISRFFADENTNTILRLNLSKLYSSDISYENIINLLKRAFIIFRDTTEIDNINLDFQNISIQNPKIRIALNFFLNELSGERYNSLEGIYGLLAHLENAIIVLIEVDNENDAFQIFECLNDRGTPLLPSDLIKNKVFGQLNKIEGDNFNIATEFENWKKILDNLKVGDKDEDYKKNIVKQKMFFRHYYLAFKFDEHIDVPQFSRISEKDIPRVYDLMIRNNEGKNSRFIYNDLIHKSKIYRQFIPLTSPRQYYSHNDQFLIAKAIYELNEIEAVPANILLLYLFSKFSNNNLENPELLPDKRQTIIEILDYLIKFFIRRHITEYPDPTHIENSIANIINECEKQISSGQDITSQFIIEQINQIGYSNKRILGQKLKEQRTFKRRRNIARYLLICLENEKRSEEEKIFVWQKNLSIEHILPQTIRNLDNNWRRMLLSTDPNITDEIISNDLIQNPIRDDEISKAAEI